MRADLPHPSRACFPANRLVLVERSIEPGPIRSGARVQLRSGGPEMLAVDIGDREVVVAWLAHDGAHEASFDRRCLRLID